MTIRTPDSGVLNSPILNLLRHVCLMINLIINCLFFIHRMFSLKVQCLRHSTSTFTKKAFENHNTDKQSLSLSNPLPEQLPNGFQPDVQNDYDYKSADSEQSNNQEVSIQNTSDRTSPNNKYEIYTGARDDRVCMKKIDPSVERKHVKEGKIPKFVIIGAGSSYFNFSTKTLE